MSVEILSPLNYISLGGHINDTIQDTSSIDGVHGKIIAYLKTKAQKTVANDILELSGIITSIENDFAIVASQLTILDKRDIMSDKFAPKWEKLHEEYTNLMRESQRGASDASNKIKTLVEDVVPILQTDEPFANKKGMLKDYIEELEPLQRKARKNADLFLRLGQEVTHFKNDLKQKVESKKQEVGDTFEEIEKKIAELESSLENFYHLEKECGNAMKTIWRFGDRENANHEEISCITSLIDIAPTVGKEMMDIALRYLKSDLADDLKKLQQGMDVVSTKKALSNLKLLRVQCGQINDEFSEVLKGLANLDPTFVGITNKISKIEGIWLLLSKDSQALSNKLSEMNKTKYETLFNKYAESLTLIYGTLQFSLDQYAVAVESKYQ